MSFEILLGNLHQNRESHLAYPLGNSRRQIVAAMTIAGTGRLRSALPATWPRDVAQGAPRPRLSFPPPDGGSALEALALLVREEPEGAIYFFADLDVRRRQRPKRRWRG